MGEELGVSEEHEMRIDGISEDVKDGDGDGDGNGQTVQAQSILQVPQPPRQPQGSVICWERFLHLRSIKVLLVENDDSTRHVVSALLHNCNYEVIEAANGLQAWNILEDITNHVDLVLTEVVMPRLSGIGLLCKIMNHKTHKYIPVIMMSSHDSMSLVLKCLSKGAVDFLVKPIRKNELKNLWQHVWRRCHSSSGSGSESATQTQKSVKSINNKKFDNSGSNDGDDDASIGLNSGDGSDNGSGTQSSWNKQAVEVDSSQAISSWDQIASCPDSTCAQVIRSNAETLGKKWLCMTSTRECQEQKELLGAESVIGKPKNLDFRPENSVEGRITKQNTLHELVKRTDKGQLSSSGKSPSNKYEAVIASISGPQMDRRESEAQGELAKIFEFNHEAEDDAKEPPVIEPSLKRLRGVKCNGTIIQADQNVLRHSELSAFSRYNTSSNAGKVPNGVARSSSLIADSIEIKKELCNIQSHSNGNPPYQSSNVGSNNLDTGSTASKAFTNPVALKDKSEATSTINGLHPLSASKPMKDDLTCPPQKVTSVKVDDMAITAVLAPPGGSHLVLQVQNSHHCHHHHHHHHHFLNMEKKLLSNHDDLSLKKLVADFPHCGSSYVLDGPVEGTTGNCSLNRSASGSNHGSNGQNGSNTAVNAGGTNTECDHELTGKGRNGDASGSANREEQNKNAHREAALTKFRQKRKDRCFHKKVRYQSRKRLAEQRPRIRGQFVRQEGHESSKEDVDG